MERRVCLCWAPLLTTPVLAAAINTAASVTIIKAFIIYSFFMFLLINSIQKYYIMSILKHKQKKDKLEDKTINKKNRQVT